jgi:hypothetical protein
MIQSFVFRINLFININKSARWPNEFPFFVLIGFFLKLKWIPFRFNCKPKEGHIESKIDSLRAYDSLDIHWFVNLWINSRKKRMKLSCLPFLFSVS